MPRVHGQTVPTPAAPPESRRSSPPQKVYLPADSIRAAPAPPVPFRCPSAPSLEPLSSAERPVAPAGRHSASLRSARSCRAAAHIRVPFLPQVSTRFLVGHRRVRLDLFFLSLRFRLPERQRQSPAAQPECPGTSAAPSPSALHCRGPGGAGQETGSATLRSPVSPRRRPRSPRAVPAASAHLDSATPAPAERCSD